MKIDDDEESNESDDSDEFNSDSLMSAASFDECKIDLFVVSIFVICFSRSL